MAHYLKSWSPLPRFPDYTGPHTVGTVDVEIPVRDLDSPSPGPDEGIKTVLYRVFYPCEDDLKKHHQVHWLPEPQREHIAAYTRFLGAGSLLSEFVSFFPRFLNYITIPAQKNAVLSEPTTPPGRWPVMVFSHGLGGSRNAYSDICGSVASHGVIVFAPEHRDGSAPISLIRDVPTNEHNKEKTTDAKAKRRIDYQRVSHAPSPETQAIRCEQLKQRLWEMGCVHDAILKMDESVPFRNLNNKCVSMSMFAKKMAVHEPGSITFAGHSFGATTTAQFIKSIYYAPQMSSAPSSYIPLLTPSSRSPICKQITPKTPVVLLDMWCMPLQAPSVSWLWQQPMPSYAQDGPGGSAILAVESQAFVKWRAHLEATKRFLSPNPAKDYINAEEDGRPAPHFFYPANSAHLNQSDFGILFPRLTKKVFAAEEPERVMTLNVRAITQLLRENNIPVSKTSRADMELSPDTHDETTDDLAIFAKDEQVKGWHFLTTDIHDMSDGDSENDTKISADASPSDAVMAGEVMQSESNVMKRPEEVEVTA